jgi:hypothetical protein
MVLPIGLRVNAADRPRHDQAIQDRITVKGDSSSTIRNQLRDNLLSLCVPGGPGHKVHRSAKLDERNAGGYSVAYRRDDTNFPVYVTAALAAMFFTATWITGAAYWLVFAVTAAGFTYYNIPLLETGRPTIGANQYGIFIQAFGLIRWRAIARIDLVQIAERAMTIHELQITFNTSLGSALVADWRRQPVYRLLMRLPWCMDHGGVVRISLEPFDRPADEIHRTFLRMWRYYRS